MAWRTQRSIHAMVESDTCFTQSNNLPASLTILFVSHCLKIVRYIFVAVRQLFSMDQQMQPGLNSSFCKFNRTLFIQ